MITGSGFDFLAVCFVFWPPCLEVCPMRSDKPCNRLLLLLTSRPESTAHGRQCRAQLLRALAHVLAQANYRSKHRQKGRRMHTHKHRHMRGYGHRPHTFCAASASHPRSLGGMPLPPQARGQGMQQHVTGLQSLHSGWWGGGEGGGSL